MNKEIKELSTKAKQFAKEINAIREGMRAVIVGQDDVIEKLIIALVCNGHILLEGVPGLAKTLMIKSLSETVKLSFKRVQFTPDLLPSDIIGTTIYEQKTGKFSTKKGPIFHHFILADEINRAPPKVQSALLEAMQEHQVTIGEDSFKLETPFLVLATQNPVETEGTYVLPEAQVDRFLFKVIVDYPSKDEEREVIHRNTEGKKLAIKKVISKAELEKMQSFVQKIYADEKVIEYVTELVDATRNPRDHKLQLDHFIEYGASPRASIGLILAGKAHALMQGRGYVIPEDIQAVAYDVLRHRVILTYEAEAEEVTADDVIEKILAKVKVP